MSPGSGSLRTTELSLAFGGQVVLDAVSLEAPEGQVLGLVGPNGAGKTSLLNCISGIYRPSSGSVRLGDRELLEVAPAKRVRLGLGRTFQHMQLLDEHTCVDNVMVGRYAQMRGGILRNALNLRTSQKEEQRHRDEAIGALAVCGIEEVAERLVSELPYGQRKLVDVARALASEPSILLLDEPMAGLTSTERGEMIEVIEGIRARGVTQIIIEHDIEIMRRISNSMVVLNYGQVLAAGKPEEVLARESVIDAYLGLDHGASEDLTGNPQTTGGT